MALSEIEKLERRYAENPQGLTFAPLAEVHRKNGEVQRALDLLGSGLAIHPDYIPASIVLGRCHLDMGDVHAAETAFLHVLSLDGENVIALKALADIGERLVKFDDAERWLHTLLSVDRSNDEAREQLQRVEIAKRQAEVASSAEPDVVLEPQPGTEPVAEPASDEAAVAAPAPAFEPPVAEPAMGWVSQSSEAGDIPPQPIEDLEPSALREPFEGPAGIQLEEPARYEEPAPYDEAIQPIEGLVGRELDELDELDAPVDEFRVETSEDIVLRSSGGSEFQMPDASQELFSRSVGGERPPFDAGPQAFSEPAPMPEPAAMTGPASPSEPAMAWEPAPVTGAHESEPAAAEPEPAPQPEPAAEPEPEAEPEPVTLMAEPEPVAAMLEPAAPEAAPPEHHQGQSDPEPETVPGRDPAPAPRRAYAATETGGRPVSGFLRDMLSARPPAQSSAPAVRQNPAPGSGAPTRPAADALSLSSVFGEEAPGTPPAVPSAGPGPGVSFDDFFGAPGAAPAQRTRAPDPKNDDLDEFHTWLQNLKR